MLFSSITFLYYYLPLVTISYFISPKKYKNLILLIFSLIFYFYGEGKLTIILLFTCIFNFLIAKQIDKQTNMKKRKQCLIIGLIINIGILIYYKYTNFLIENINNIFNINIKYLSVIMPLGISFFTFQTISYLIDVYKKDVKASKNIVNLSTYISLFPQLVAGPIVRYKTINEELEKRQPNIEKISYGISRFIIGLSKKVLIANNLGLLIDNLNNINTTTLSTILISISFTLQIYFDFSGYSDMAIGLGKIFGFDFLENFNYPFISKSITEFWRRWHISLSSFFKDYIYIPLGGSKCSKLKWVRNILIVWSLTGLWHGAQWNFIIWGLFFAIILLIEKLLIKKHLENKKILSHIYTIVIVLISFTIFNSNTLNELITNLKNITGLSNIDLINKETIYYLKSNLVLLAISIIGSTPLLKNIYLKIKDKKIIKVLEVIILFILLIIITAQLVNSSFNPFLYFRF
ncbi:MAG: MBOAT family protein [Bacilli bacterium]|nr:MBOAT family protein [Bacilli bacterium]